jgi:zinc/manganese transport system permease protein
MLELMLPALAAALILVASHGYLGIHVIARGVIFVDLALAQVAALGYTTATLLGYGAASPVGYAFGIGATLLGALLFSVTRVEHKFITQEAIIGTVFVVASAGTILMAAQAPRGAEHVEEVLAGSLLWVTWPQILRLAVAYVAIFSVHWVFRKRFLTVSLRPDEARELGWSLGGWDFLFYALFGLVVTMSVAIAGVLLVFTFLVIPAVIAFLYASRPLSLMAVALSSGSVAAVAGVYVSFRTDLPTGPLLVVAFGITLVLAYAMKALFFRGTGAG